MDWRDDPGRPFSFNDTAQKPAAPRKRYVTRDEVETFTDYLFIDASMREAHFPGMAGVGGRLVYKGVTLTKDEVRALLAHLMGQGLRLMEVIERFRVVLGEIVARTAQAPSAAETLATAAEELPQRQ